jgi:hypothetical protein
VILVKLIPLNEPNCLPPPVIAIFIVAFELAVTTAFSYFIPLIMSIAVDN